MKFYFSSAFVSMSKLDRVFFLLAAVAALTLALSIDSGAQTLEVKIKLESSALDLVKVKGRFLEANAARQSVNLAFLRDYAGAENLGERISQLTLSDAGGRAVQYKKLASGEFLAASQFSGFEYQVKSGLPKDAAAMAHVSWIGDAQGILMLGDLLPQFEANDGGKISAKVVFELPPGWRIISADSRLNENAFEVADVEKAIFLIGQNQREREIKIGDFSLNLAVAGEFLFAEEEASEAAREIFTEYQELFGAVPNKKAQILLIKFPGAVKIGRWEAETRGATVTVLSADMPFKTSSLQRLHEQMRHELFHLWMPNDLNLSGNYDWFYEGFALYGSLRAGVELNKLRFEDFLDTLARAYSVDALQTQKVSLIEASKNRWNGANTQVYARGMLVAFLCDLGLLRESKGKRSISEVLRQIYAAHRRPNSRREGNDAIIKILENYPELRLIIEKYIRAAEPIVWRDDLQAVGIEAAETDFLVKLTVKRELSGRQKDLLNKLGYNNWRKMRPNSK